MTISLSAIVIVGLLALVNAALTAWGFVQGRRMAEAVSQLVDQIDDVEELEI